MRRDTCQISWKPKTPGNGFGPQCKTHSSHIWPHLIYSRLAYHLVWESNAAWWRSRRQRCKKYPQKAAAKRLPNLHKCLSTHKSHHSPICVLQIEYNDRMGRLEKAQTSQGSPWPREQCVGTQNLQIHLQETPSWCLKVLKTTGLKMLGVLVYLCSKIYLQTFLTASGSCRPKTTYEGKTETSDVHCHAGPHGKFQRACCLEPHLVNTSLATKHGTHWSSSWVLDAHHGQASTGPKKHPADPRIVQTNKADLGKLAMWCDICQHVSTVNVMRVQMFRLIANCIFSWDPAGIIVPGMRK